jgi:hypothetical protein
MMTREEYEQRKRRLEEQLEEALELVRAGFRQQIRALEMVWLTTASEEVALAAIPVETARREAPAASATAAAAPLPAKASRKPRQPARKLWNEVDAVFDDLPRVFDRNDVMKALGYEPERSSLYRVLTGFRRAGDIVVKIRSLGRIPAKYEKVEEDEETADGVSDTPGEVDIPPG